MNYFGLANQDNADRAEKVVRDLGYDFVRKHEVGYHNFYFDNDTVAEIAANEVSKVVDKSTEDGEW